MSSSQVDPRSPPESRHALTGRHFRQSSATILSTAWRMMVIFWSDSGRQNMGLIAAGVGFFATLSIFPALTVLVLMWSLTADPVQIQSLLELGGDLVPADVHALLSDQITGLITAGSADTLGWASIFSALFAFWSARAGIQSMIRGLEAVHEVPHLQRFVRRELVATGLMLAFYALSAVVAISIVVVPILLAFVALGPMAIVASEITRFLIAVIAVMFALWLLYRFGVDHADRPGRRLMPGVIAATVIWLAISIAFTVYLQNFANYNEIYGSIGAVVALLMWVYLSAYAALLGGALNASYSTPVATAASAAPESAILPTQE